MKNVLKKQIFSRLKLLSLSWIIPKNFTGSVEYSNGNKRWLLNGLFHRINGPAVENADETKKWYLNGIGYSEKKWKIKVQKNKS